MFISSVHDTGDKRGNFWGICKFFSYFVKSFFECTLLL
jgi:hypothetical protein